MYEMDGKRGDGWGRGMGISIWTGEGEGGNYLEGGLGWWWLVLEELDGRRDERGRAREGGAYPPVIADVAVLGGLLLALGGGVASSSGGTAVGRGGRWGKGDVVECSHDKWPLQHFKSK
ncbi:hypothetical protein EDC04DRAFT_2600029 [Pisolithus marmoratus]|nr:hypothetical protein EDC04DRAFT_2600029 [Pisolithus marmoratus]